MNSCLTQVDSSIGRREGDSYKFAVYLQNASVCHTSSVSGEEGNKQQKLVDYGVGSQQQNRWSFKEREEQSWSPDDPLQ
jgi:hypothetical protein